MEKQLFIGSVIFTIFIAIFIIWFLFAAQKRSFRFKQQLSDTKQQYENEMLSAAIEIQEAALQQVSDEIHDNIGQLLSIAKMNLNVLQKKWDSNEKIDSELMNSTKNLVSEVINEIRSISRSISPQFIEEIGFAAAVEKHCKAIEKSGKISVLISSTETGKCLTEKEEVVLFRIFQESTNNAIKHSNCNKIYLKFTQSAESMLLSIQDNGDGFVLEEKMNEKSGLGLKNLERKAHIIHCKFQINSSLGKGTEILITKQKT